MEFFATCGTGLEKVLADELRISGVHGVRPLTSGVSFHGGLRDAYLASLWSRTASRVLLTLGRIDAQDADALYEGVHSLPWEDHIDPSRTIAVDAHGTDEQLRDTRFTALRAKDAICDRLREIHGSRPDVDAKNPDVRINISLQRRRATISIDLSGTSLDRREYRVPGRPPAIPIRENLAAAVLLLAGWRDRVAEGAGLLNPFCGTGTLAIEAALIAGDIAPGISRSRWGFEGWLGHDEGLWNGLLDAADARAEAGAMRRFDIVAADPDAANIEYARACARKAGIGSMVDFTCDSNPHLRGNDSHRGLVVCIPPDGQNALTLAQAPAFYATLAAQARREESIERLVLLTPDPSADGIMAMQPNQIIGMRNGAREETLRIYDLADQQGSSETIEIRNHTIHVNDASAGQFAARLNKMAKQRAKWARQEGVGSYRVYDADLPDYNLAIDYYGGAGSDEGLKWIHVAEYAAPRQIDPDKVARRLSDALTIIPIVFEVDPTAVFVKRRYRSKGGSQYTGVGGSGMNVETTPETRHVTSEGGLLLEIGLADHLDTGLFLDHRPTRALLRVLAKDKRFLNLFAYTGTATIQAAAGGAFETTTVDLSNTYLDWARRNMSLNGFDGDEHKYVRADVLAWVAEMRHSRNRWDLVFVDPPTFSNSAGMGGRDWDVQRDHAELLIDVSRILTREGVAIFSCNLRDFEPDMDKLAKAGIIMRDITARTIPVDFERNPKVHHCYLLKRG